MRPSVPRICVALAAPDAPALEALALETCARGEDFLELRLDALPEPLQGVAVLERLLRRHPDVAVLATCRRIGAKGSFAGSIAEQERVLAAAAGAGARLLDVEIETAEPVPGVVERLRPLAPVMVSFHDFESTPAVSRTLKRLRKIPADAYKLAVMARKPSDNARLLALLDEPEAPPLVALAMGEVGAPSRILSPARGAVFTFAAPDTAGGTAPGQFPASAMRNLYQSHQRSGETRIYGVIADPVAHSLSPALHNRAFRHKRVDACYLPFRVAPERLSDFFEMAEALPVSGFSVTIPHKQRVMRRLDAVDELARRIGAVNTVYRKQGRWLGTNTDALGVTAPLERKLKLARKSALVVGTGGAARAAVFSLVDRGARVTVAGRSPDKASRLARAAGAESTPLDALGRYDILVQTTPVGMHPNVEGNLFPDDVPAEVVFDMVYNPLETALLRRARELGRETIEGLEMFIEQAAAQFELWTAETAPREIMRQAVLDVGRGS